MHGFYLGKQIKIITVSDFKNILQVLIIILFNLVTESCKIELGELKFNFLFVKLLRLGEILIILNPISPIKSS